MARFKYRMQNILNIKEKLESQAKNEYAQANMELAIEVDTLGRMKEQNRLYKDEARRLRMQESLSIRDMEDNKLSQEIMKYRMQEQKVVIRAAEEKAEQKRQVMTGYRQERRMHERLKEKAFEQFMQEDRAAESKQIDELTSYTYNKNEQKTS